MKTKLTAVIVISVLVFFYGRPVYMVLYTKWKVRNMPEMWIVPTPLPNGPIERSSGLKLSYYGYEFEVPWTELKQERKLKSMVFLNFVGGAVMSFHDPSQEISELEVMKQRDTKQEIGNIFGVETTSSSYAFRSRILSLTPKDLSVFSSRQEMVGNSVLLVMKPMHAGIVEGGLFSFQTEWLRGFQDGDPAKDKMTLIDGFDAQDREVEFWVGSQDGSSKPTQADINRILYSLRPVVASSRQ